LFGCALTGSLLIGTALNIGWFDVVYLPVAIIVNAIALFQFGLDRLFANEPPLLALLLAKFAGSLEVAQDTWLSFAGIGLINGSIAIVVFVVADLDRGVSDLDTLQRPSGLAFFASGLADSLLANHHTSPSTTGVAIIGFAVTVVIFAVTGLPLGGHFTNTTAPFSR